MSTSRDALKELAAVAKRSANHGEARDTAVPQLLVSRYDRVGEPDCTSLMPCVCLVVQGAKEAIASDRTFSYKAGEALVNSVHMPIAGRIVDATPDNPFLCWVLKLESGLVCEVSQQIDAKPRHETPVAGIDVVQADDAMLDGFVRLVRTLDTPAEVRVVAPLIVKEIVYRLLMSNAGMAIRRMVSLGGPLQRIAKAVETIRARPAVTVSVQELADQVNMSPSAFYQHFRRTTNMSPIQYQKRIRLEEARKLLVAGRETIANVASRVGYESSSQFHREYRRLFGRPPCADAKALMAAPVTRAALPASKVADAADVPRQRRVFTAASRHGHKSPK